MIDLTVRVPIEWKTQSNKYGMHCQRVATVREKYLENEFFSRSGKSLGILWMAREI